MTELIVALDSPNPAGLASDLVRETPVRWFKIGPQGMTDPDWRLITDSRHDGSVKVFLDLKLADTYVTVMEALRRFAGAGIAAVSTYTTGATAAALEGARGTPLKVWRVVCLTDGPPRPAEAVRATSLAHRDGAHGIVCPPQLVIGMPYRLDAWDIVCPAIRLAGYSLTLIHKFDHHAYRAASECVDLGISHAVVGRPIWQAPDPVAVARDYLEALRGG